MCLSGLLLDYDYLEHVPSDVASNQIFLPADKYKTQDSLDQIARWSKQNLVELNEKKAFPKKPLKLTEIDLLDDLLEALDSELQEEDDD